MAAVKEAKWSFSKQILEESPSRKAGIDPEKELSYRQQAANLIQDMGQRLSVNQLTINTAIVYMHRFYVYHSFTVFSRYAIAPTALFLAAKVEEQPKKLQHVLQICHACLHPDKPSLDTHSEAYMKQAQELVNNELVLLQTLGFEISVDHPHTHVVKCTQLVKASRDLSQMAYFMATNSLHLTTFCLLYKPTVVAAMCIHLSCKWSNYEIPLSSDGKAYWSYMDPSITEGLLDTIITEFLKILNRCPTRLRKLKTYRPSQNNSNKEGQESKEEKPPSSSQHSQNSSQAPPQQVKKPAPQPTQPQPPPKEKKQALSFEEYKKAQAAKTKAAAPHRPPQAQPLPRSHGPKPEVKVEQQHPPSRPQVNHKLTHSQSNRVKNEVITSAESVEELAMAKVLEGRIQSEKLQQERPSHSSARDHSKAQPEVHSRTQPEAPRLSKSFKQLDRKQVADLYQKNPDKLRQYLKYKAQFFPLTSEEKSFYGKMQARDEERRKRKAAAENAAKQRQSEPKPSVEASCVESPNGPLTLRIKLGARPDTSKSSSVAKIVASDSDTSRKRVHDGQGGHPSASKHAKRSSEKHHRHHHSRHNSSSGENKHRRSNKHSSGSSKAPSVIDEAVFQKSLSEAMNQVQQQQQTSIPTVTLKRANNGKEFGYFASVPRKNDFDPTAPVSTEIPDDIFEEEQSSSRPPLHQTDSLLSAGEISADTSTPDSADIVSPTFDKKHSRSNKVTSLFSPDANTADSQLMRSSSGYHSSQDNDYQPPVLLQNHSAQ